MIGQSFKEAFDQFKRKKVNWLVLFILPLLLVLMMGVELDNEVIDHIPMAVIDYDNSTFSRQLIDAFGDLETFDIISYPETQEGLEALMRDSEIRVGMIIPEGFYQGVKTLESPTVLMIYDGSHMSITSAAKSKAVEVLLTYKVGAAIQQLTGRLSLTYEQAMNVGNVINFQNRTLYNPGKSFEDFLAPVLLGGYVQGAIVLVASLSISHDIYRRKRKERMGYAVGKVLAYTVLGTLSFILCILVQVYLVKIPFVGSLWTAFLMCAALSFAVSGFSVLISAVIGNRMVALLGGAVVFIPNSVMAGTTWPVKSMPSGYQGFAVYTPFARFANNLRDIYLKGVGFEHIQGDVRYMLAFGIVSVIIAEGVLWLAKVESDHETMEKDDNDEKEMAQNELLGSI